MPFYDNALLSIALSQSTLARLAFMRFIILIAQCLGIAIAYYSLVINLLSPAILSILGSLFLLTLWTIWRARQPHPIATGTIFLQLLFDSLALSAWLYCSGGSTNPFVAFYLPLIAVAAAILPWILSSLLSLICLVGYSLLNEWHIPLNIADSDKAVSYHLSGMWANFIVSAALITWFVARMSQALRKRELELAEAREHHLRNEAIIALGMQAAHAAHEMGTPLSTILMLNDELKQQSHDDPHLAIYKPDFEMIEQQIHLCKKSLDRMVLNATSLQNDTQEVEWGTWLSHWIEQWRLRVPAITIQIDIDKTLRTTKLKHHKEVGEILIIILDNAVHASATHSAPIQISLTQEAETKPVVLSVNDQGRGIAPELLSHLGHVPVESHHGSQGIGLLLAFAQAKKIHAHLSISPHIPQGTSVQLSFPPMAP